MPELENTSCGSKPMGFIMPKRLRRSQVLEIYSLGASGLRGGGQRVWGFIIGVTPFRVLTTLLITREVGNRSP